MRVCSGDHRARARSGRSTPRCGPRARTGRWCARWPATSPTTSGGRRPGSSRRCSRPGRSPATSTLGAAYVAAVAPLVWQAAEPAETSSPTCRRCAAGSRTTSRPAEADRAAQARARAACATSSSPCSCCSSCTAAADETLRSGTTLDGARGAGRRRLRRARRRRASWTAPTGSCAPSSTGIQLYRLRRTHLMPEDEADLRRLGRSLGLRYGPGRRARRASGGGTRARCAGCTRSSSTGRCWRGRPARAGRGAADPRGGAQPARGARLRRPGRRAAAPRGARPPGVSRRAAIQRTLLPVLLGWFADAADPDAGLLAFRQGRDALGTRTGTCGCCGTRARPPSGWRGCSSTSRYAADLLDARARGRRAARATTRSCGPARRAELERRSRGRRRPRDDDPATAVARGPRRCAAASCSGSRPPTCSASSTVDAGRRRR